MTEAARRAAPPPADRQSELRLEQLRKQGAAQADPLRFHYAAALARRLPTQRGEARHRLEDRLAAALAACAQSLQQARDEAERAVARLTQQSPAAADELQRLCAAGEFGALRRFAARLAARNDGDTPLAALTRHLAQLAELDDGAAPGAGNGAPRELKAIRRARTSWARLSVARQLTQAVEQAPENAGPLNSQRLLLQSLALMRDVSPDYLARFMSYADTLLALEQAQTQDRPAAKATRGRTAPAHRRSAPGDS